MHGLYQVYERGQTHFQIGDNTNLFDWTYVGNVARAHIFAADKLISPSTDEDDIASDWQHSDAAGSVATLKDDNNEDLINYPLPSIDVTTGVHRIPTCEARPLGPYITRPPNADAIEAGFYTKFTPSTRPVVRSRFDQFSDIALARAKTSPLQVAGQAFFITNGEPMYFWDFMRAIWHELDVSSSSARPKKRLIVLPRGVGMALAGAAEWWGWLVGKESAFTRFRVQFSCATRWHNIEKARRVLGYEPEVGLEEGMKKMVEWWKAEHGKS
jgi:sterol-4alpha-carboxylate 3-dehydrogenase (decarboxylating)